MAAMLIPLAGFSGSAIDMARLYTVKSRLQQACDAGVLAGRKSMAADNTIDTSNSGQAQTFFNNNFNSGWFKTANVSFKPSVTSDYQVQGVASATVPMTIMAMFGQASRTLTVTCQARYDVADADIMFVLDTTGSMACTTADDNGNGCGASVTSGQRGDGTTFYYDVEESGSKIAGLRSAILSFYDTLAASADSSTHIRYGFVPYTSTVNVGAAITSLMPSYIAPKWQYQSRVLVGDANNGGSSTTNYTNVSSNTCNNYAGRTPATGYNPDGSAIRKTVSFSSGTCAVTSQPLKPQWSYGQYSFDVSQFVSTLGTTNLIIDPTKVDGTKVKWQGCIEERPTKVAASFDANSLPPDMDPDLVPNVDVDSSGLPTSNDTRWRPMWPDVIYYRGGSGNVAAFTDNNSNSSNPLGDNIYYPNLGSASYLQAGYATCVKPALRLQTMTRSQVSSYVNANDFKAIGGTYHDTGMIWGTRLISPTGIFKADTAPWPGRQAPNRYIVFMTDGQMETNQYIYGLYGLENYDQRVTGGSFSSSDNYHNARFVAECQAAKNRNITVFVIGFGQTLNSQLTACASPGQAYYASDNAALTSAFQKIAQQVAMLRISK